MTKERAWQTLKRHFFPRAEHSISEKVQFARLYNQTHLSVFRYVYALTNGPLQEAEDLTAETFTRAWKTRESFTGTEQAAFAWLLRIARNLVIDQARSRQSRAVDEEVDLDSLVDPNELPESEVIAREQVMILWKIIGTLPTDLRELLALRYMLGWQVKQIAEYLEQSENHVSVRLRRTFQVLRQDWSRLQEQENG